MDKGKTVVTLRQIHYFIFIFPLEKVYVHPLQLLFVSSK